MPMTKGVYKAENETGFSINLKDGTIKKSNDAKAIIDLNTATFNGTATSATTIADSWWDGDNTANNPGKWK